MTTEQRRLGDRAKWLLAATLIGLSGCTNIGVQRIGIDRSDYTARLRESNKEQLLLNIVAIRYGDAPLFLEVSSVISQYTREGSARGRRPHIDPSPDDQRGEIGGSILLRETPTVTYTPLTGDRFARGMLAPIPPTSLLALIEFWLGRRCAIQHVRQIDQQYLQ